MKLHITLIALAVVLVLLAGCDEAPAAGASGGGGRGKYSGRCFPVKSSSAFETLGNSIAPSGFGVGGPENNRITYRVWTFLGDPRDLEFYRGPGPYPNSCVDAYGRTCWNPVQVYVVATSKSFAQMESEGQRICVGDLIKPGRDSVTWRTSGYYWGTLQ